MRYINPQHLRWINTLGCSVCKMPGADPHHLIGNGESVMSSKASDLYAFPLCRKHHKELHDHGFRTWEEKHGSQWEHVAKTLAMRLRGDDDNGLAILEDY